MKNTILLVAIAVASLALGACASHKGCAKSCCDAPAAYCK